MGLTLMTALSTFLSIQPALVHGAKAAKPVDVDVVVLGGGYSGLVSAHALQEAGLSTVLLEARDQVGGRSRTLALDSGPGVVEMGATWINNSTQPEVWKLTQRFGLETLEQYTEGDTVFQGVDGGLTRSPLLPPGESSGAEEDLLFLIIKIASLQVDIRDFDKFPEDQDVTIAEWFKKLGLWEQPGIPTAVSQLTSTVVGREPEELGMHYFLDYVKSGGGFDSLGSDFKDGAQALLYAEGSQALAFKLAEAMSSGSVLTSAPGKRITQCGKSVIVTTEDGRRFRGKKAIVAIPTNIYPELDFSPPLPESKQTLGESTLPGIYAKILLTYACPWWREAGLVGKFTSLIGPVRFSWEVSNPALDQYNIALFVSGDAAADWTTLPEEERIDAVINHLSEMVADWEGLPEKAKDVLEINYVNWTEEEYLWGGPTSSMGPGLLRKYGEAMREPFRHLHFGGGETAYEWKGYLEGAVTAGQRAAEEVIEALK